MEMNETLEAIKKHIDDKNNEIEKLGTMLADKTAEINVLIQEKKDIESKYLKLKEKWDNLNKMVDTEMKRGE